MFILVLCFILIAIIYFIMFLKKYFLPSFFFAMAVYPKTLVGVNKMGFFNPTVFFIQFAQFFIITSYLLKNCVLWVETFIWVLNSTGSIIYEPFVFY